MVECAGQLLSRHAVTGVSIDEHNWIENVNNRLQNDVAAYIDLCRRAEFVIGAPICASFCATPQPAIIQVDTATMTDSARLTALVELFRRGGVRPLELLKHLQPWMFGYLSSLNAEDRRTSPSFRPASSPA
jgi:hypothetical protein